MKKITANEIDYTKSYIGYLWYSDESKPRVLCPGSLDISLFTQLPFILEGYLYCPEYEGICLNIKNIEGEHHIYQVHLKEIDQSRIERFSFLTSNVFEPHGIKKFKALQYWSSEKDELCEGMDVLNPAWIAFEGFEYINPSPQKL